MSIQTRVVNILTRPAQEWKTIAGESADVGGLIKGYAAPLSGIAAICQWLGLLVFVRMFAFGFFRLLISLLISWILGLVGAWVAAIAIERLAPGFSSRGSTVQALKLVVYATTPVWVFGILTIVPVLTPLLLLAVLYAVYLFYLGLPVLMETPADKVIPYMVVSAVVVFIANAIVRAAASLVAGV